MATHRHKRDTNARRLLPRSPRAVLVAGPLAVIATSGAVALGVAGHSPSAPSLPIVAAPPVTSPSADTDQTTESHSTLSEDFLNARRVPVSRSQQRKDQGPLSAKVTRKAINTATEHRWTTTELNLWTLPGDDAEQVGELDSAKKVLITGRMMDGRDEVVVQGRSRWVTEGYLSTDKPPTAAAGLSMDPCPDPSVEYRLTSAAVYVYRSVCHAFPQITTYGGWDAHGEHTSGRAIDIMTSDVALGDAIAAYLQEHAAELNLYDIIWRQRIWTPERASEGWRSMPDRGSATANHYDHVHVAVN